MKKCTQLTFLILCTCYFPLALFSQLPLNLDFEKLSVEGIHRPWGWNVYAYSANTRAVCDSLNVHAGTYSLLLENKTEGDSNLFELAFFMEPSQILNKKLRLEGWIKTESIQGNTGLRMFTVGPDGDGFAELEEDKVSITQSSKDWKKYTLSLSVNERAHSIYVSAFLSGQGKAFVDDLKLYVDDQLAREVPVAPSFSLDQIEELGENTRSFSTVQPSTNTEYVPEAFTDLYYFKELVGDARIIALGEATHGTGEFFQLKHRLFQYAVHELGTRVFVLEDNQLLVERVNQFVLNGKGTAREVIKGLFAVWSTQEMLELIQWVRDYNLANPDDKLEFVGMDVQNPQLAIDSLTAFLEKKDEVLLQRVENLWGDYKKGWQQAFYQADSILIGWEKKLEEVLQLVSDKRDNWLAEAQSVQDQQSVEWAVQNARLLTQNMASIRSFGFEGRDKAMAENVEWILNLRKPGTRMVVWAHDSHINRGEAQMAEQNYFLGQSMGAHLTQKFGDDYRAFGLFTYGGLCRGTISYSNFTQIEFDLFTSPVGSLDEGLHQLSLLKRSPFLLMNLRPYKKMDWMNMQRPVRYVGYVAEDYGFGGRYVIPDQFDGVFFVDKTRASKEINNE